MENFEFTHIVLLGRNKELAIAELEALLSPKNVQQIDRDFAFIKLEAFDAETLMNRLGSSIKISSIEAIGDDESQIGQVVLHLLRSIEHSGKLIYGINTYPITNKNEKILKNLLNKVKKVLKEKEVKSRYLNKGPKNLHTALVLESKVIRKGIDVNIFKLDGKIYIGKTEAIQNINSYSFRDFKRPARDAKSGMLPPKFAQTLINLAYPYMNGSTIYDPFCGSGTVLQEARLMGYEVIGSDISEKAIKDSKENMEWLDRKFGRKEELPSYEIFQHDISKAHPKLAEIQAIACEGYLGPPLFKTAPSHIKKIHQELTELYSNIFKNLGRELKKGSVLVMALPFHAFKNEEFSLTAIPRLLAQYGFKLRRPTIKYRRSDQIVGREIFIVTKESY